MENPLATLIVRNPFKITNNQDSSDLFQFQRLLSICLNSFLLNIILGLNCPIANQGAYILIYFELTHSDEAKIGSIMLQRSSSCINWMECFGVWFLEKINILWDM